MLDLKDVIYSVQVVDRDGFTSASKSLRIPKSALSNRVQQLDASLGIRLVNRTSRRFGMTDVGREFYSHALTMWAVQQRTDEAVSPPKAGTRLIDAAKALSEFEFAGVVGTLVGLWSPGFSNPFSAPGYHLHFLSEDRTHGGHLLACSGGSAAFADGNTHRFPSRATGERSISQGRFKQELG
jgi:Alpha-acetolactate decarboxylase/Bacterial regulatory helix-turn-helix protein, lysR family